MYELKQMLQQFASGDDQSHELVRKIDKLLSEKFPCSTEFPDVEAYEDLEVAIACFRPGGGQFMYDEAQMATICTSVLARLNQSSN